MLAALRDQETGTLDAAAAVVGLSRRALAKACARDPVFAAEVEAARKIGEELRRPISEARSSRRKVVADPAAKMLPVPRNGVKVRANPDSRPVPGLRDDLVADADVEPGPTVADFVQFLWDTAQDGEHKGCSKAIHVLAEYKLGPIVRAQKRAEDRAAEQLERSGEAGVVIVALPANGTEAPGHEPRVVSRGSVLDAEASEVLDS